MLAACLAQKVTRSVTIRAAVSIRYPAAASPRMATMTTAGSTPICRREDQRPPPTSRWPMPVSAISISTPTVVIHAMIRE